VATRSSLLRQKTALHRNLAIPLQEDKINNNSEGDDEFSKINFEEKKFGKIEPISEQKNKLGESQGEKNKIFLKTFVYYFWFFFSFFLSCGTFFLFLGYQLLFLEIIGQ